VCLCCVSVFARMHVSLRVSQGIYIQVCLCVRAWVSVFEECAYVEMRDSIIIATQSEQRSSGHSKLRNNYAHNLSFVTLCIIMVANVDNSLVTGSFMVFLSYCT
jgi:hypothetical protein